MKFRNTLILAAVLALGIWGVVYLNKQDAKKEETKKSDEKILTVAPAQIKEMIIEPSGIHARRDSSEWKLESPVQTLGDKSNLDAIANLFDWAKKERVVSSNPAEYGDFGLRPARTTLILKHDKGQDSIYIGDNSPTGGFVFARKSGSADVFLTTTSLESNTSKSLFDLRDKSALAFDRTAAREMSIQSAKAQLLVSKEGSQWRISKPIPWRADETKVSDLLSKISNARASSFVDENPVNLAGYGLDKPLYTITVLLGDNLAKKSLFIGKADGADYYAKDDSRKPVFKVDSAFVHGFKFKPDDYRSKKIIEFSVSEINKVVVKQNDSTFVFEKDTTNTWAMRQPGGQKIKTWKVSTLVSDIELLQAESFAAEQAGDLAPYGLSRPVVQVELFQTDRSVGGILLGKNKDGETMYLKRSDTPTVFVVKKETLDKVKINFADLLETTSVAADSTATTGL